MAGDHACGGGAEGRPRRGRPAGLGGRCVVWSDLAIVVTLTASPPDHLQVTMPDRSTPHFGPLLRRHRLATGLSQAELAERAGLSPDGIRALETGRRAPPRPYTVRALAEPLALAEEDRLQLFAAAQAEPA